MPSRPRRDVVDETVVGAYHVYGRSARQDFLLGPDPVSGRDYSYRKELMRQRLELLATVFAVECLDFAVLDNHFHAILRNRPDEVSSWSARKVAERWLLLNRARLELRKPPSEDRIKALVKNRKAIKEIRRRLSSISWFMAYFREQLARVFNTEDGKSGHFWERFGCERLEDEAAILACSAYLAMNQLRAGMATSVETSYHTSVQARLEDRMSGDPQRPQSGWLAPVHVDGDGFAGVALGRRPSDKGYLNITFDDYLDLVDQLMQRERAERLGRFEHPLPPIIERLGIRLVEWEKTVRLTSRRFTRELDRMARLRADAGSGRVHS